MVSRPMSSFLAGQVFCGLNNDLHSFSWVVLWKYYTMRGSSGFQDHIGVALC